MVDHLSARVLDLGPDVTMHVLKFYIAFKAGSNFVDVVPQAAGLRLALNMEFEQINDPRGICDDVTGLGQWGNGDVRVMLTNSAQLDYCMELIEQAYRTQSEFAAI